jgi:membrane associated rhomboid family serine protease
VLIVPADAKFRQGRWPVLTALLILANVLVFFTAQLRDDERRELAWTLYFDSSLPATEFPLYLAELRARGDARQADALQRQLDHGAGPRVLMTLQRDAAFQQQLRAGAGVAPERMERWRRERAAFESAQARVVTDRYHFDPLAPSAVTLFTSMFLHGDFGHLLGNMVMLGLVGVLVEYALGPGLFALLYVAGGLGAGLTYWAVHYKGGMPVIGASGAIAGVMGLFAVLYGRRKVRFFYWLGFYFDFIALPALALLPYWLGWEILQFFMNRDVPVAYEAHAGGLAAGALLALAARRRKPDEASKSLDKPEQDARWDAALHQGMALMGRLEFDRARVVFEKLHRERPADLRPTQQLFRIAKAQPSSEAFHRHAQVLLTAKAGDVDQVLDDYWKLAKPAPRLEAKLHVQLLNRYAVAGDCERVDRLLQLPPAAAEARAVARILDVLAQRVPSDKGRAYRERAAALVGSG